MKENNRRSVAAIAGQPFHPILVSFPVVCFMGAFITDIAYWRSLSFIWETFSVWLLTAGLVLGFLAAFVGLIDFASNPGIRASSAAWVHRFGSALVLIVSLVNVFIHSRDGYTAVVPTGIVLSGVVVLLMLFTGWMGSRLVYHHGVGVTNS